jgi:hypothetical protein
VQKIFHPCRKLDQLRHLKQNKDCHARRECSASGARSLRRQRALVPGRAEAEAEAGGGAHATGDMTDGKINCCWFFPRRRRDSVLVGDFEYVKGVVAATPAFSCRVTTA